MRVLLLIIILATASGAAALAPPSPASPSEPLPTTDYAVTLTVPRLSGGDVNSTFTATYSHNAPTALSCSLWLNSTARTATVAGTRTEEYTLPNGAYSMNVSCSNTTITLRSATELFRVSNAQTAPAHTAQVKMVYPPAITGLKLNVTFEHNASSAANCNTTMDGKQLELRLAEPNHRYADRFTFDEEDEGDHIFAVKCTNGTWTHEATKKVNITTADPSTYGVTVEPSTAYPGSTIRFKAQFLPYKDVLVQVTNPLGTRETFNTTVKGTGQMDVEYTLPITARSGTYKVSATSESGQTENGTFMVLERKPAVWLAGNKTTTVQGSPFLVFGEQFLPDDRVTLTLTGGSGSIVNMTTADAEGAFTFLYPGTLAVRSYNLVARSGGDTTLVAYLSFNVTKAPVNTTPVNSTPVNSTPPPTPEPEPEEDDDLIAPEDPEEDFIPPPETEPYEDPDLQEPAETGSGFNWLWIVIALVVVILGVGGFLVYNGTIDLSSLGMGSQPSVPFSAPKVQTHAAIDPAEKQTIKSFIYGERQKGFDDLTIRSSLVAKGWDKSEVDRVFDEIYRQ